MNKACSAHAVHRADCFGCKKATALAERAEKALVPAATAMAVVSGPRVKEPPGGQFRIECSCGVKTQTRYLTGQCECGRYWEIQWDQAKKEYEKVGGTSRLKTKTITEKLEKGQL